MELDELKNIWKEKKAVNVKIDPAKYDSLINQLKRSEKKVFLRYMLMTIFMAVALYTLGVKVLSMKRYEDLTYVGMYLILVAVISVGALIWSTAIILSRNDISNPGREFLEKIRKKLYKRSMIRKFVIPVYLITITIGITLAYIEVLSPYETYVRILGHLAVVVFILGISIIATKREKKRYEKTIKPIEIKINELLSEYDN